LRCSAGFIAPIISNLVAVHRLATIVFSCTACAISNFLRSLPTEAFSYAIFQTETFHPIRQHLFTFSLIVKTIAFGAYLQSKRLAANFRLSRIVS
jgi:hypothetical protein